MRPRDLLTPLLLLGLCHATPSHAREGCGKDTDCKGERICNAAGHCVEPKVDATPCPPCDCAEASPPTADGAAPPTSEANPPQTPATQPKPAAAAGDLAIMLLDDSPVMAVEVTCPNGFRERAAMVERKATVSGLPAESCVLFFRGPVVASFRPVTGGMALQCHIEGAVAVCQ